MILSPSWVLEQFDFLWFLFHTWSVGTPPPHLEAMEGSASEGGRESRRGRGEGPVGRQPCHTSPQTSYYRGSLAGVKWGWGRGLAQVDAYFPGVSGNSQEWNLGINLFHSLTVPEFWNGIPHFCSCWINQSHSCSSLNFPALLFHTFALDREQNKYKWQIYVLGGCQESKQGLATTGQPVLFTLSFDL